MARLAPPAGTQPISLDSAFVARAIPTGSAQHLSYLFASSHVRRPLLGIYALLAEWRALSDPATERTVAQIKLSWWHEEMSRLTQGMAVHPVSRYLASQPGAAPAHFAILIEAVEAAMVELGGVPLERGLQLESHSTALLAGPLRVASRIAYPEPHGAALDRCTQKLAMAQYLSRALSGYRRDAASGRVPFAVDELLQAGVENGDLLMPQPPARLRAYLDSLRRTADQCYADAAQETADAIGVGAPAAAAPGAAAPGADMPGAGLRHLLVLAALGRKQLNKPGGSSALTALGDMLLAWKTARRAIH